MSVKTFPFGTLLSQAFAGNWASTGLLPAAPGQKTAPFIAVRPNMGAADGDVSRTELLDWEAALGHWDAWDDLSRRSAEPNVFMNPGFALSEVQHIPVSRRPSFLFTWRAGKRSGMTGLSGLFSLQIPMPGAGRIARIWCTPMMALGTPLIDRQDGIEALDLLHKYIAENHGHIDALILPQLSLQGPVATSLMRHAKANHLESVVLDRRYRAVVTNRDDPEAFLRTFISPKKRKELRRQRRRLEDIGSLTYSSATSPEEVRAAMEQFLSLEASGWKGGQQSALLSDPSTATFVRSMSRFFARQGACRIDALELDHRPIAMGIVLAANDTAFYWKTAYDEKYGRYSPGVLFSIDMTVNMMTSGTHELINSCAIPDHPMIDHIWRERLEMGDLCVASLNASPRGFAIAVTKEQARRRFRTVAKSVYYSLMRKHPR